MNDLVLESVVKRNPEMVFTDMDGETVMLDIESGQYIGINAVGSRIWQMLEKPLSIRTISRQILDEYEVDEAQCQEDTLAFVRKMLQQKLVLLCE